MQKKKLYYKEELSRHQHNPKKNWETLSKLLKQKDSKNCLPNKVVDDFGVDASDAKIMLDEFNKKNLLKLERGSNKALTKRIPTH